MKKTKKREDARLDKETLALKRNLEKRKKQEAELKKLKETKSN